MSLIDAAQRARSAVLLAVEKDPMHAPEQLAALHSEMHARIEGIKTLASRANIDLQSNSIERRERRFAEAAKSIIDASQRRREAAALVNKSLARLTELTQALRSSSASLAASPITTIPTKSSKPWIPSQRRLVVGLPAPGGRRR